MSAPVQWRGQNYLRALADFEVATIFQKKQLTLLRIVERDGNAAKRAECMKKQGAM